MAATDLITLADYKVYAPVAGAAADQKLASFITTASRMIEDDLGRRIIYRAPPSGEPNIVDAQPWTTGSIAVAAQPNAVGRTLKVVFSSQAPGGVLTITGTVAGATATETFDAANGREQHGLKFFTGNVSAAAATAAGSGTVSVMPSMGYVEYHTPFTSEPHILLPLEWPVAQVLEVNEDSSRAYGALTKLQPADFLLTRGQNEGSGDRLIRLSSSLPTFWQPGWRAERQLYSGGYTAASVPQTIRDACRRLVMLLMEGRPAGVSSMSDALGNFTRFTPTKLTRELQEQLTPYRRYRFGAETGERDFDLEAA